MVINVNSFLDICKERTLTASDSNLARKVEITRAAIAAYRKGSSFPSDENMVKLANRAKLDTGECLLLLNVWRSGELPRKTYLDLMQKEYPKSSFL